MGGVIFVAVLAKVIQMRFTGIREGIEPEPDPVETRSDMLQLDYRRFEEFLQRVQQAIVPGARKP
jgi:hypothetical protein